MEQRSQKYSDKEIIAAINVVHQILSIEDFTLEVAEYTSGQPFVDELKFNLVDKQHADFGNIEEETFFDLASVIDRLDIYHNEYFHEADCDKEYDENGEEIISECDRKFLMFLESDYCTDILASITASIYVDFVKTGFGNNQDRLNENEDVNELSYLLDRDIAQKIIDTQSAYQMVEWKGRICISRYTTFETKDAFLKYLNNEHNSADVTRSDVDRIEFDYYGSYREVLEVQKTQILNDISDLGFTENDNWNFYLSQNELIYIGIYEKLIKGGN